MREIKFRARHKITREWFYSSSLWRSFDDTTSNYELPLSTFWQQVEKGWLDPKTVGQYTDNKDKNGNEIYEGGITKRVYDFTKGGKPKTTVEQIIYYELFAGFAFMEKCKSGIGYSRLYGGHKVFPFEVIGDIYENPELLDK